jgi:hypothetical protein
LTCGIPEAGTCARKIRPGGSVSPGRGSGIPAKIFPQRPPEALWTPPGNTLQPVPDFRFRKACRLTPSPSERRAKPETPARPKPRSHSFPSSEAMTFQAQKPFLPKLRSHAVSSPEAIPSQAPKPCRFSSEVPLSGSRPGKRACGTQPGIGARDRHIPFHAVVPGASGRHALPRKALPSSRAVRSSVPCSFLKGRRGSRRRLTPHGLRRPLRLYAAPP